MAALDAAEVPCTPVQRIDEVVEDPQLRARNMFLEQNHPVLGRVTLPNVRFTFSDLQVQPGRAPLMGEHNREILRGLLGYSDEEITRMEHCGLLHAETAARRLLARGGQRPDARRFRCCVSRVPLDLTLKSATRD